MNEKHGKTKCWEFKKCGREGGGVNERELGSCPSYPDGGRQCWLIAGTLCGGKVQGEFAQKYSCLTCEFLLKVKEEEGKDFKLLKDK